MNRTLAAVFAASLCLLGPAVAAESPPPAKPAAPAFADVSQYEREIRYLTDQKIIGGFPDGAFRPEAPITRIQAVNMLLRAKGVRDRKAPDVHFVDVARTSPNYPAVAKAVALGWIGGKPVKGGKKRFDPVGSVTRGQMAQMLAKAYAIPPDRSVKFYDVSRKSAIFPAVSALAKQRIATGANGKFLPLAPLSRQHFSLFLARAMEPSFRPSSAALPKSYLFNSDKTYVFKDYNGRMSIYNASDKRSPLVGWERWDGNDGAKPFEFYIREDETGHYTTGDGALSVQDLKYPLTVGQRWAVSTTADEQQQYKVTALGKAIKTPAGSFADCAEVTSEDGWTFYYANNVGFVRSVFQKKVQRELIRLK